MAATSATAGATADAPSGYARFCNNTLLSDVVLVVGKGDNVKRFSAHRVVLAAASPQLAALVIKDEKSGTPGAPPTPPTHSEIAFPDDNPAEFQLLLSAIYGDATALSPTATARLLPLVSKYGVKEAADACVKAFGELTPETALAAYALLPAEDEAVGAELEFHRVAAERKRQREEKKGAPKKAVVEKPATPLRMLWLYLLEQAQEIINLPAFKELPKPKVEALLSSEMLNLDEPSVFRVLLDRAKTALNKEKKAVTGESMRAYLGDMIKHCRFPLFGMSDLATVVAPTDILSGDEMVQMFQFSALAHTDRPPMVAGFKTASRSGSSSLLVIKLWGGGGGGGQHSQGNGGGCGGFITANYRAVPGEELRIIVGRGGTMADDAAHSGTGGGLPNGGHGDQNYRSGGGGGSSHVISVSRYAGEVVIGAGGGGGGSGGISSASGGGGGGGTYDGKVGRGGRGGWTSSGWDAGVGVDGGGGGGQGTSSGMPGAGSGDSGNTSGYFSGGGGRNGAAGTHGHGAGGRTGTGGGTNGGGGGGGAASAKYVEKESIRIVCGSSSSAVGTEDPHFQSGNNGEGGAHGGGAGRPGRVVIIRGNGVVQTFETDGTFTV